MISNSASNNSIAKCRIAYMLGTFPAITETFIHREMRTLREQNIDVIPFAVKRPAHPFSGAPLLDEGTVSACNYARPGNAIGHLLTNLAAFASHPFLYLETLSDFVRQATRVEPPRFCRLLYHFFCGIGFTRAIANADVKRIHSHFTTGSNMGYAASRFLKIPFSMTVHASDDIFVKPLLLDEKMSLADCVIADSDYARRYVDSITDYKYSGKLRHIYTHTTSREIDDVFMGRPPHTVRRSSPSLRITSVGSLVGCKGHVTLLEACRVLKQRGHPFSCKIVGGGRHQMLLTRLIKEWQLDELVTLTGYLPLDSVYRLLAETDVFALLCEIHASGYRDGLPTAIVEAMLLSLPVVSTHVSGIPEIVVDGETGFLVPERDPIAAADAFEKLALDESLRDRLGDGGRERASAMFDENSAAEQLVYLLAAGPHSRGAGDLTKRNLRAAVSNETATAN
jgi:glycosyltransferase involved in cell wall biosynthesis